MHGISDMMRTTELEAILKKYPRGHHAVSKREMDEILDAYDYWMESPGGISGKFGVTRETLRVWGKKKIIHYFVCRDRSFRVMEAYIPLYTFLDAKLPNSDLYQETVDDLRKQLERIDKRRRAYYEEQIKTESKNNKKRA
jgi:hypothetical protein